MKLTIDKSILENALATLQPFLEKKDMSLIAAHIKFEIKGGVLFLRATDGEIGLTATIKEFEAKDDGAFTASGKKILENIRLLKDGAVSIETKGETVTIKQNRTRYTMTSFDANMFPSYDENPSIGEIAIDSAKLITGLKKISPAIATNNPKFELNGALIDVRSGVINIVSTDTKRLAIYKIDNNADKNLSIIVPKKAIAEIQKIFASDLKLYYDETNLSIKNEEFFFFTKVINGKFPDYERIIPREIKHSFSIDASRFIDAIKQSSSIAPEIKISFNDGEINFETLEEGNEKAEAAIEAEIAVETPIVMAVNSKFILDFLSQCQTESFAIGINEPNTPFILKSENFSTIVMPIML